MKQANEHHFSHLFTKFATMFAQKKPVAEKPVESESSSTCEQPTSHFTNVQKAYQKQCVLIIAAGYESKVSIPAVKAAGFAIYHYSELFFQVASQFTRTYQVKELANKLERTLSPQTLFVKFYHWARNNNSPNAKLCLLGTTRYSDPSIKRLCSLGAIYLQHVRSFNQLPNSFCWPSEMTAETDSIWNTEQDKGLFMSQESCVSLERQVMPRVGWSHNGLHIVVILLGPTSFMNGFGKCGCYVYNNQWIYESMAQSLLYEHQDGDTGLPPGTTRLFANRIREACNRHSRSLVLSRFADWWKTTLMMKKAQVAICGLDPTNDVSDIQHLRRLGAIVFAPKHGLTYCNVQVDHTFQREEDLVQTFKHLYRTHQQEFDVAQLCSYKEGSTPSSS